MLILSKLKLIQDSLTCFVKNNYQAEITCLSEFSQAHSIVSKTPINIIFCESSHISDEDEVLISKLISEKPRLKVLYISSCHSRDCSGCVYKVIRAGVKAYIDCDSGFDNLRVAVNKVMADQAYFPMLSSQQKKDFLKPEAPNPRPNTPPLTSREQQVLRLIVDGLSNKETSKKLNISIRTVESHRVKIMKKLKTKTFASLIKHAVLEGLA